MIDPRGKPRGWGIVLLTIYGGHYWAPAWEMNGLFHNHADRPADVSLVVDVLDMWDFIEGRAEKLSPEEAEKLKAANHGFLPKFVGFDGNNEATLMSISRFKGRDFNSHAPTAARYRRMAEAFQGPGQRCKLAVARTALHFGSPFGPACPAACRGWRS